MRIKRAVKAAAIKNQLDAALDIAQQIGVHGLEVQELLHIMKSANFEQRGNIVIESCKGKQIRHLSYHVPLIPECESINFARPFDLASAEGTKMFKLADETLKEAGYVAKRLGIESAIPVTIHLFGFMSHDSIEFDKRKQMLEVSERKILELMQAAEHYSDKFNCKLKIARENNPPEFGYGSSDCSFGISLDLDIREIARTFGLGAYATLDFGHLWQYMLYQTQGRGEFPAVDLSKKIYPKIDLEKIIEAIAPSLLLLHMNDAGPTYREDTEGIEIGLGTVPHERLVSLIIAKAKEDIIGTYEVRYCHKDPKSVFRSDLHYRNLFKERFDEYFE